LAGLITASVSGGKVTTNQGQYVHAGGAGSGHAVGCVVDGEAAAGRYIEPTGRLDVQVGGRLAARYVFSRDNCCELVRKAESFEAWLDELSAGSGCYGAGQSGAARGTQESDDTADGCDAPDRGQEAGAAVLDDLVVGQMPGTWQLGQQVADGQAGMPEIPAGIDVESVGLQCGAQRLLVAGCRIGEGAVEVEDHRPDALKDRGMVTHDGSRLS
jgi:hypothetical protein